MYPHQIVSNSTSRNLRHPSQVKGHRKDQLQSARVKACKIQQSSGLHTPSGDDNHSNQQLRQYVEAVVAIHRLTIHSPSAYRTAMVPIVLDAYLPRILSTTRFSAECLTNWLQPWSLASQAASEAVGLLQVASDNKDVRVRNMARQRIITSLGRLREDLRRPDMRVEAISVTAQALMAAEMYVGSASGSVDYFVHLRGLQAVLASQPVSDESSFRLFVARSLQSFSIFHGIVVRRGLNISSPYPSRNAYEAGPDTVAKLIPLTIPVPELLEQFDQLQGKHSSTEIHWQLLTNINRAQVDLHQWFIQEFAETHVTIRTGSQVVSDVPNLDIGQLYWLFDYALDFAVFHNALCHVLYSICVLQLAQASYSISYNCPAADNGEDWTEIIDEQASNLCRCVPYLLAASSSPACRVMLCRGPLFFAKRAFNEIGQLNKMLWCDSLEVWLRKATPYLEWDNLLPWTLFSLPWTLQD